MKIKNAIILCAGYGKRMLPLTKKIPKPLIKINNITLLENCIIFLSSLGVKNIYINTHYLQNKIKKFIKKRNFKIKIKIFFEKKVILNTGGGVLNIAKKINSKNFIVINPDTIWNKDYILEFKKMEKIYLKGLKPTMLLVDKKKSFDKSFKGDFSKNTKSEIIRKNKNRFIYTGAQILNKSIFKNKKLEPFSMNIIWKELINKKCLMAVESKNRFIHVNNYKIYKKITYRFKYS